MTEIIAPIVDCHCDTLWLFDRKEYHFNRKNRIGHIDLPRLQSGGVAVQFFAVCTAPIKDRGTPLEAALHYLILFDEMLARTGTAVLRVEKMQDLDEAEANGKVACLLALEGAEPLCGNLELLSLFYRLGVRCISLTWNERNCFADGCAEEISGGGLTRSGRLLISRMEALGIVLDLAHLSRAGFRDALELATRPPLVSHANCFRLCEHPRNLTDEQLKQLAERGGVMGLTFYPPFITGTKTASLDQLLDHFVHAASVAGVEHVGIGSDFDGISESVEELDHAACYPALLAGLRHRGFSFREIKQIAGENVKRLLKQNLK
jgi:membrane dipeptidase